MKIRRVLIVYKKSAYEAYFMEYRDPPLTRLAKSGDKGLAHIQKSHHVHYETLRIVEDCLRDRRIRFRRSFRGKPFEGDAYDLVISVGGDGTFLDAARNVKSRPVLGVNSDVNHSVGRFCAADRGDFSKVLDRLLDGRIRPSHLNRMELRLNNKVLPQPALNDILVSHLCPAAMSHYILQMNGISEHQGSSGVWIATAAGSTGAAQSAGGKTLPVESAKLQYIPRELFDGHGRRCRLRGGIFSAERSRPAVISQMKEGRIYVDGAHASFRFRYGDRLEVRNSPYPLCAILF